MYCLIYAMQHLLLPSEAWQISQMPVGTIATYCSINQSTGMLTSAFKLCHAHSSSEHRVACDADVLTVQLGRTH